MSSVLDVSFVIGQRVRNEIEPSLGLGVVKGAPNARTVEVFFPAAAETRCYNISNAPLRRHRLAVGCKDRGLFAHPQGAHQLGARRELFSRRQPRRHHELKRHRADVGCKDRGLFAHPQGAHQWGASRELYS